MKWGRALLFNCSRVIIAPGHPAKAVCPGGRGACVTTTNSFLNRFLTRSSTSRAWMGLWY